MAVSARLPAAEGAVVLQALRAAAGDCEHPHRPHHDPAEDTVPAADTVAGADSPRAEDGGGVSAGTGRAGPGGGEVDGPGTGICRASLADALVAVAGAYLSGKIATAGNPDLYQVIVHVGPEALTDGPDRRRPAVTPPAAASPPRRLAANARPGADGQRQPAPAATPSDTPLRPVPSPPAFPRKHPPGTPPGSGGAAPCRVGGHRAHPRRCHLDDGPAISPAAARALACHATVSWMLHDHDGTLLDVGTRGTAVPPPRCAAPSANATTAAASSPAAGPGAPTSTTSSPGPKAARPDCGT